MTSLEKLTHFMKPNYQLDSDKTFLEDYITEYTYPECAAAALWEEIAGSLAPNASDVGEITTGAEKFKFISPLTTQSSALVTAKIYSDRCDILNNNLGCAIRITQSAVAGIPGKPID